MKQQKLTGYQPGYPKKFLKSAVLTTAAIVALGSATGCALITGQLTTDGVVPIDEPRPTEELILDGEVAIDETTDIGGEPTDTGDEVTLSGDVMLDPEQP